MRKSKSSGFARRLERERDAAQELLFHTSLLTKSIYQGFASCLYPHLVPFPFHCANSDWKALSPALMPCTGIELHCGWGCRFLLTMPSVSSLPSQHQANPLEPGLHHHISEIYGFTH